MKASPKSWHRKLNDFVFGDGYSLNNSNLCPYFWGTLASIICVIPMAFFKGIRHPIPMQYRRNVGIGAFISMVGGLIILGYLANPQALFSVLFVIGVSLGIVFGSLLGIIGGVEGYRKIRPAKYKAPKPNMFWEMLKAWKNKHCPMLEWTDA